MFKELISKSLSLEDFTAKDWTDGNDPREDQWRSGVYYQFTVLTLHQASNPYSAAQAGVAEYDSNDPGNAPHALVSIEDYDIDVIAYKDGVKYRIEVEVKNTYFENQETYPFDTVSFLGRKKKYSNPGMFYYFLLSTKHNSFLYCESDIIYQEKHKETATVNTSQRYGEDLFYRVPKELCKFRQF